MSDRPASVGGEVLYEVADHIALVTLNRPEKRNAVNGAVVQALDWIVAETERDDAVRAVILASSLDSVFCAGADLGEIASGNASSLSTRAGGFAGFVNAARTKPWVAAVRGSALAGGCELALSCDMIVASDDARLGLPEVKRGIIAAASGLYRLPRALPRHIALELIATGDPLGADRAHAFGLVNHIAPADQVLDTAHDLARRIAVNAPLAVRASLAIARKTFDLTEEELRKASGEAARTIMASEDAKEGPRAFLEKRAPNWVGR